MARVDERRIHERRVDAHLPRARRPARGARSFASPEAKATVQEVTEPLPISQPAVSKHLNVLEEAGLERRDATPKRYARLRGVIRVAVTYLTEFQRSWDEQFARLDDVCEDEALKKH